MTTLEFSKCHGQPIYQLDGEPYCDECDEPCLVVTEEVDDDILESPQEEEQQPWRRSLTPLERARTIEKIEKINKRAEKRGWLGRLELKSERKVYTHKNRLGVEIEQIRYESFIAGDPLKFNGWTFLARADVLPSGEFTLAIAPGVDEQIDRSLVRPGDCDHCGLRKYRKNTYLVQSTETGEIKNVGSTCIKDFLGWAGSFSFLSAHGVEDELFGGLGKPEEETWTVETILTVAYLAIREFGWVKSDVYKGCPTKFTMMEILNPPPLGHRPSLAQIKHRERLQKCAARIPEAKERVPAILEWIESLDDRSDFNINLKVSARSEDVTRRQLGLLAYAPEGYARHLGREAEWKAKQAAAADRVNDYIGNIGDRIEISGTIEAIKYIPGQYGTTVLYTIVTDQGLVKWFASSEALGDAVQRPVRIKGTVKKHDTFRETKSTVLSRCVELEVK